MFTITCECGYSGEPKEFINAQMPVGTFKCPKCKEEETIDVYL